MDNNYMIIHVCVCMVYLYSFAALFSPAKRRQLEKVHGNPRRPIFGASRNTPDDDEEDGGE